MPRTYTHIKEYREQILKLKTQGYTRVEIAEELGLSKDQTHQFVCRYNRNQRKMEAGNIPKRKGRPAKTESLEDEVHR